MKKTFTILIAAIAAIMMITQPVKVMGQEKGYTAYYTLECSSQSGNSAYGSYYDVNVTSAGPITMTWNAPGNQTLGNYWRIGGKKITNQDRTITGKTAMGHSISKIVLNHNGKSNTNLTINSIAVTISNNSTFTDIVETITKTSPSISVSTSGSLTFEPNDVTVWAKDCYYKITINCSNSKDSNYGLDITSIVFYKTTYTITYNANEATGGTVPSATTHDAGSNATVASNTGTLVRTGYNFSGWNTANDGSGTDYAEGATISGIAQDYTLYAKWTSASSPNIVVSGGGISSNALNLAYTASVNQTVSASFNNMTGYTSPAVALYNDLACTEAFSGDWFNASLSGSTITYNASANAGAARTVYMRVSAVYSETTYYSNVITITQAELPQLTTPSITAITQGNEKVTPTWSAVANASSYTIDYATNNTFTEGLETINNITSGTDITGLTNETTYYFRLKAVGDGTNYRTSEWSDVKSATPNNRTIITITQAQLADFTNSYAWYDWNIGGVTGSAFSYKSTDMQFNMSKTAWWVLNTSVIPGVIKSVKMTSTATKSWIAKVDNSAFTKTSTDGGTSLGAKDVTTSGVTWDVTGNYCYFLLHLNESGASIISSIEISYIPKDHYVTYKANGGTGSDKVFYYDEDETVTTAANNLYTHPSSYTFNSWNTAADGSGTSYAPAATFTMPDANVTLYAQWNHPELDLNGNNELTTNTTINSGEVLTIEDETIIPDGKILTVNGVLVNDYPDNLIINEGGQLILAKTNTGVKATVKKNIEAATAASKGDAENWYAISADVANPTITSNTNLITGGGSPTYDLYRYDETKNATSPWENYRNPSYSATFTTLQRGRGYLYRNASDLTITMTGDVNVEDFNYTVTKTGTGTYAGFNLIGNPYTHEIYKGDGTAIPNGDVLNGGFYILDPSDCGWKVKEDNNDAIAPNQAILVQSKVEEGTVTITNTKAKTAKSNNDYIRFILANDKYEDAAFAWFDNGEGLNKIDHRNPDFPMLYINQNGEDYAIATMSDDTKAFNLNLRAKTFGKYTLSYKTKGIFSYLHVIDRMTGEDIDMLLDGEYSFIASPTDNDNRFLVYLGYLDHPATESSTFAFQNGSDITILDEGELQVFDVTGRMVKTANVKAGETISAPSQGVYIFRLIGNEVRTQKIVVR